MTTFSNLILVYDKEKRRFCWKIILYHYSLHPWEYFTQKIFLPMCTHSMEFDSFYRAEIYGRPCILSKQLLKAVKLNLLFQDSNKQDLRLFTPRDARFNIDNQVPNPPVYISPINEYNLPTFPMDHNLQLWNHWKNIRRKIL